MIAPVGRSPVSGRRWLVAALIQAVADGPWPRAFADGHAVVPLLRGAVRRPNATLKYWSLHL